jgi:hypothetical protein
VTYREKFRKPILVGMPENIFALDFKTGALNNSATLPALQIKHLAKVLDGESPNCHPIVTANQASS